MEAEVFMDAAYAVALSARSDQYHQRALDLRIQITAERTRLLTTQGVILEVGNALSKRRYRAAAIRLIVSLLLDPSVDIVPLSADLVSKACQLFTQRDDKEWGLTDCVSFVVMRERGIHQALTADGHFHQAGFVMLLE